MSMTQVEHCDLGVTDSVKVVNAPSLVDPEVSVAFSGRGVREVN